MRDIDDLARRFEAQRGRLRAVAYRMLGSLSDADDAVQQTWLRLAGADTDDVRSLDAWLTTVVSRVCLDMLRSRQARHEAPLETYVPDPIVTLDTSDPEDEAILAESVGVALLVVLDTLSPTERLAFVLHDVFAVPFEQIGAILTRSPAAAKQLASRARHRLQGGPALTTPDPATQRRLIDAFLAAARDGDFEALLAVLDPQVVLRADAGDGPLGPSGYRRGARAVAEQAQSYAGMARWARPVLVNGAPGLVAAPNGEIAAVMSITVADGRIAEINILADPQRLARLDLPALD